MTSKSPKHSLIEMVLKVVLKWLFHWDLGSLKGKFPTEIFSMKVCTFVLFLLTIINFFFFSVQFFSDSILLLVTKNQNIGTIGEPFFWFLR